MFKLFKISRLCQPLRRGLDLSAKCTASLSTDAGSLPSEKESPYWRDSATVILAARDSTFIDESGGTEGVNGSPNNGNGNATEFDYKILLMERNKRSKFMGGAEVFPGGTSCDADFSLDWANVFRYCTKRDLGDVIKDLNIGRKRPPLLAAYDRHTAIPPDLGFRIAAIRETFEESGVLLVKGARMPNVEDSVIEEFKEKVKKDPRLFSTYCRELQVVPDVWALQEWSNWLTPVMEKKTEKERGAKPYRFDTIFYLCCLDWIPLVHVDGKEITDAKWVSPGEYFEGPANQVRKFTPQPFEMARLYNFPKLAVLHTFAKQRAALGLERYMFVSIKCKDGHIAVLPGDSLYPEKPDYAGLKSFKVQPHTIEDLRSVSARLHRLELAEGAAVAEYVRNVEFRLGQPAPHRKFSQFSG